MVERRFEDGEAIYRLGDFADGVFRVRSGSVRITRAVDGESPKTVVLNAGKTFGDAGFLRAGSRDDSAVAAGETVLDVLSRDALLDVLSERADLFAPLLSAAFAALDAAPAGPPPRNESSPDGAAPAVPAARRRLRLVPEGRRVRALIGVEEIEIARLPYRIGRRAEGEGLHTYDDIDLALKDSRPFSLSRRHLSIETHDGELVVRDCGSYHGTIVAGIELGSDGRSRMVPLRDGETSLIVGGYDSPFRFTIVVG